MFFYLISYFQPVVLKTFLAFPLPSFLTAIRIPGDVPHLLFLTCPPDVTGEHYCSCSQVYLHFDNYFLPFCFFRYCSDIQACVIRSYSSMLMEIKKVAALVRKQTQTDHAIRELEDWSNNPILWLNGQEELVGPLEAKSVCGVHTFCTSDSHTTGQSSSTFRELPFSSLCFCWNKQSQAKLSQSGFCQITV